MYSLRNLPHICSCRHNQPNFYLLLVHLFIWLGHYHRLDKVLSTLNSFPAMPFLLIVSWCEDKKKIFNRFSVFSGATHSYVLEFWWVLVQNLRVYILSDLSALLLNKFLTLSILIFLLSWFYFVQKLSRCHTYLICIFEVLDHIKFCQNFRSKYRIQRTLWTF